MSIRNRWKVVLSLCACASLGAVGSASAYSLHRIAALLDLTHITANASFSETLTYEPFEDITGPVLPSNAELNAASTEIEVHVPSACDVEIQVIDEAGNRVCGARVHMPAGVQKLGFCGRDAQGRELPNGVYYYNVIVGDHVSTTRVAISR